MENPKIGTGLGLISSRVIKAFTRKLPRFLQIRIQQFFGGSGYIMQFLISMFPGNHVRNYYKVNLFFDNLTRTILKKDWPRIDRYLLTRKPKLNLDNGLAYLNSMYMPDEIRIDNKPYLDLASTILPVISELKIKSVVDVGCSNGLLVNELQRRNIKVAGYEVFDFLRGAAPVEVKNKIIMQDFRTLFKIDREFDLVVSLEVGEHIDPTKLDVYLQNLVNL